MKRRQIAVSTYTYPLLCLFSAKFNLKVPRGAMVCLHHIRCSPPPSAVTRLLGLFCHTPNNLLLNHWLRFKKPYIRRNPGRVNPRPQETNYDPHQKTGTTQTMAPSCRPHFNLWLSFIAKEPIIPLSSCTLLSFNSIMVNTHSHNIWGANWFEN